MDVKHGGPEYKKIKKEIDSLKWNLFKNLENWMLTKEHH
jgi:hypothetical protein